MLKAVKELQTEVEALLAPHAVFVAATLRRAESEPTTYEVLDPECAGVLIKGVKSGLLLTAVLGLDYVAKDPYKLEEVVDKDGQVKEALLRENAPTEEVFQTTLEQIKDRQAVAAYHAERIAARAAWAQQTKVSITYAEYYGLRQLVQKAQLEREDAIRLLEAVVKAVSGAVASLKDDK